MPPIRHLLIATFLVISLTACGRQGSEKRTDGSVAEQANDPVTNTTTEAMCADASDRAHAIGRIAEDPKFSSDPDAVYEVASDIAQKGCPKPSR